MTETWPVASSPATGHPAEDAAASRPSNDIDLIIVMLRQPLIDPPPIRDKALEDR